MLLIIYWCAFRNRFLLRFELCYASRYAFTVNMYWFEDLLTPTFQLVS